jgi:hypothetical protein
MRINVRLIRVSQFLSQFRFDIRHKSDKDHIISDALSRLVSENFKVDDDHFELDALYIYNITLVKMTTKFRQRLTVDYIKNSH